MHAVLDTGSGPSLIRRELLPAGTVLQPLGDLEDGHFFDLNGGWLPIRGSVMLGVAIGDQVSYNCFGVIDNMSVPVILGNSFNDVSTKGISTEKQYVTLKTGTKVPIIRAQPEEAGATARWNAVCACPQGTAEKLTLAHKLKLKAGTVGHVKVRGKFQGHGLVHGSPKVHAKHGVQVANGPAVLYKDTLHTVQVINPSKKDVRLPVGTVLATVTPFEGPVIEVTEEELHALERKAEKRATATAAQMQIDLGHVPEELREKLKELVVKHQSLWDGTLGLIKNTEHRIRLRPGATPVRQYPYKAGHRQRQMEDEQVEKMRKLDVIEPATGEWASPVVLVPKPDGTPRFCIDYRRLNEVTVKDAYPIPRMDECLDSLGEAVVFSTLDCNAGYWQIPLAEEDKHLTAFTCHKGTWQCLRLPFGLCNAPATFQRAMDIILAGVKWRVCLVYLDDVIVFSRSAEEHLAHLDQVLTLLKENGVSLKASKCHLFQEEVEYLGHVVRPGRISVNEKNTKALRGLHYPRTQTQLKSFLGMCGVYRRFVPGFAKVARPLTALTSTKLPKELPPPTEETMGAFKSLRDRLLSPPILAIPREGGHYIVDVDASYEQLGCSLLQQQPDGEYLPVGFYSRGLAPAEKNYCAIEIEALGVVWAVTHLRSFLEGTEFLVRCDHAALTSVMTTKSPSRRLTGWRLRLSEFTYQLKHKPGKDHKVADAMSRLSTEGLDTSPLDDQILVLAVTCAAKALTDRAPKGLGKITLHELIEAQAADKFCQERRKEEIMVTPAEAKWQRKSFFFEDEDGVLCRRSLLGGNTHTGGREHHLLDTRRVG